jgi:hypothetical protein
VNKPDLPNTNRRRKSLAVFLAVIVGAVAAIGVWLLTVPPGPGLDPDSASYLGAATALAHGHGYRIPIANWRTADSTSALAHFPPGYPTAIAVPVALGAAPTDAARVVNAAAAFVSLALATWLVASVAGIVAALALGLALLVMHAFVLVHLSVLSEPMFLASIVCAVVGMDAFAGAGDERSRLVASGWTGVAAAVALLVRYAGLSVVIAVALWTLRSPAPLRVRVRRVIVAVLPAALVFGAWVLRSYLTTGTHSIRTLGAYGGIRETVLMGVSTIVGWLVPLTSDDVLPGRGWIALLMLLALAAIVARGARQARASRAGATLAASGLVAASYLVVLMASRLLADPDIPFDERILVPLFLLLTILIALAAFAWASASRKSLRIVGAVLLVAWLGAAARATEDDIEWLLENGLDFAQAQWTGSPVLAWARANASRQPLYSNWPAAIVFHLHRPAHELPKDAHAQTLAEFADTLRVRHGIVIAFDQPSPGQIGVADLTNAAGLRPVVRLGDGTVFAPVP